MRTARAVLVAAFAVVSPLQASSQMLQGRVIDTATGRPVAAAALKLMRAEDVVAQAVSDSTGRFVMRAERAGRYRIAAVRIGYAEATSEPLELPDGQTVAMQLELSVEAVRIAPLRVEVPRDPYLEVVGFYDRMQSGAGVYLSEAEIARRAASTLVDLLRTVRGVRIQRVNWRSEVYLTSPTCLPQIVLDGIMVRWGGRSAGTLQPLDDLVRVAHIEAVEVYRAFSGVPTQYVGPNAQCGTILVWTRHR